MDFSNLNVIRSARFANVPYSVVKYNDKGHYCGYIKAGNLPHESVDVHKGWTYDEDEGGWVGFDCNHLNDVCLDENGNRFGLKRNRGYVGQADRNEWKPSDVGKECKRVIKQMVGPMRKLGRMHGSNNVETDRLISDLMAMGERLESLQGSFQKNVYTEEEVKEIHEDIHYSRGRYNEVVDRLWENHQKGNGGIDQL